MDKSVKEQILNILKNNKLDDSKTKFVKIKDDVYKFYYYDIFVTYIEINNNNKSKQALNWKSYRPKMVDYMKRLEKFDFDVTCIVDITDEDILSRCIQSLNKQTNEPYIILIVSSHNEKQLAVDNNVDFFWTTERSVYKRFSDALISVRGNFKFVKNVMLCNSSDIFFDNWIADGVKMIHGAKCDIVGTKYHYMVDLTDGSMYKRTLDQEYGKKMISYRPWTDLLLCNGLIINKVILNKISWKLFSPSFKNNLTFGIFDQLIKTGPKIKVINSSDTVYVLSDKASINITEMTMNKCNIVEPLSELPILNKYPMTELNVRIKPLKNRKIYPTLPKKKKNSKEDEDVNQDDDSNNKLSGLNLLSKTNVSKTIFSNKDLPPEKVSMHKSITTIPSKQNVSISLPNLSNSTSSSEFPRSLIIREDRRPRKREPDPNPTRIVMTPLSYGISDELKQKLNMIKNEHPKNKRSQNKNKNKNKQLVIPGERKDPEPLQIPMIMKKEPVITKSEPKRVVPPDITQPSRIEVPLIINKELVSELQFREMNLIDRKVVDESNKNRTYYYLNSPKKIVTIVMVNNNVDITTYCTKYLKEQTMETDIIFLLNNARQKNVSDKLKIPYFIYDSINEHVRIQSVIKQIKNLNPEFVMFIDDNCCLSSGWVEECYNKIKNNSCDIVGQSKTYLYNYKANTKYTLELIADNLNFISKHYRNHWSFFNGRMMSKKLLYDLNWHLFSSNYDVDIEVSLGIKLTTVKAKLGRITSSEMLTFISEDRVDQFNSIKYYLVVDLEGHNGVLKSIHNTFNYVLGEYKEADPSRVPLIQRKQQILDKIKHGPKKRYTKTFKQTSSDIAVTVVLPTYNGYPNIETAVANIMNQTFKDYELLIINDGSSQLELTTYLESIKSNKIRVIDLPKNKGLPNALNVGIQNAKGRYWTWISDDNEMSRDFLWKLKTKLDNNYGFVYSNYIMVDKLTPGTPTIHMDINYNGVDDILDCWRGMPSYMWRKDVIDQIGYFDTSIEGCEDYEYVVRTFIACGDSIGHVNDYLFTYYKRFGTLTTKLFNVIPELKEKTRSKYRSGNKLMELHHLIYTVHKEVVVYISDIDYHKLHQRPHQILKLLTKDHECFFVSNNDDFSKHNGVWVINKNLFDLYVKNFNLSSRNLTIYFNDPKFHDYKHIIHPQCTIFDLIDNPVEEFKHWNKDLKAAVHEADIVTYSSRYLESVIKDIDPEKKIYYISNGCDFKHFSVAKSPIQPKPKLLSNISKPIVGYYGAVSTWLDYDLIKKIADMDEIHVVMVGGIPEIRSFNMTFDHKNITWVDHVDYDEIPKYLSWFSICMIPFKESEMIKGCNPIKFYEYYAAGKIVIGTVFDIDDIFYYKIDGANYDTTIQNILKNCDLRVPKQDHIKYAEKNSWGNQIKKLLDVINVDYTIIYPPIISYDFLMQRPTQLMKGFGKIDKIRSIFVSKANHSDEKKSYKFMVLNKSTFESSIRYFIKGKLVLYYTYPDDIKYKKILNPDYVIFDLIDNPTGEFKFWNNDNLLRSIREADLFVSSADIMYNNFKHYNSNSLLVSNGCDYPHFESATKKFYKKAPNDFPKTGNKIVVGYYGAHASWVDFDLVKKLAEYKSDRYTVVMVGKSSNSEYNRTFDHHNITWIDHKKYDVLPSYLAHFDICIIPFKLTDMIKGCDPIKFHEYMSAGKPILATKIEPILKYKDVCYFMDHKNYGNMLDQAVKTLDDQDMVEQRRGIAITNSWEYKSYDILNHLLAEDITVTFLYPPFIKWHRMYQRPQQMITALSMKKGVRCIFIDYGLHENNVINHSLIITPSYEKAKKFIKGRVILYYNDSAAVNTLTTYKYDKCIFELVDNPVDEFSKWTKDLNDAIKKADQVSITSMEMAKYVDRMHKSYTLIPNGADYYHFERAERRLKRPNDMPIIKDKTVVGYYGAHAPWVDWDLIKMVADMKSIHVVMIGRMEKIYNYKFEHNNITWLPLKDYSELPYYLSWFDICMIPFKLTEMIKGCDPIKFYEYCSAGKPVVATEMQELVKYNSVCYFINNDNYKAVIKKAIAEKDSNNLIKKRQEVARSNSWSIRADEIMKMVT